MVQDDKHKHSTKNNCAYTIAILPTGKEKKKSKLSCKHFILHKYEPKNKMLPTYLPFWLLDFREDNTEGLDYFQKFYCKEIS